MSLADALTFPSEILSATLPVIDPALLGDSQDVEMQQAEEEEEEEEPQGDPEAKEEVEDEEMGDLFGDDAAGTPPPGDAVGDDGLTSPERRQRKAMEYEEDDQEEPQEVQLRDAAVQIPNLPVPKSSDGNYWVIRMPNFVKLDSKPFHPDTYVGPEQEDDETLQQQVDALKERSLSIKLEVENTVRWRWVKGEDGEDRKQSNSRIVRWSDGSLSLQLGNELFDVNHNIDTSAAVSRSALGGPSGSQSQMQTQTQSLSQSLMPPPSHSQLPLRSHGLTYLVAQHKRAEVLQAEKLITGHLTLRPTGMQSETHRKLVRAVGQKHNKVARLRMAPSDLVQRDPDKELAEMAKNAARKPRKSGKRAEDALVTPRKRRGGNGKKSRDQVWSDDDEEPFAGSEDESDDGLDGRRKVKKKPVGDDTKKGPGEYQTDDFVVSDEDDEDDDDDAKGSKKRPKEEDEEQDSLDEAEAKIAKRESKKRKKVAVKEEDVAVPKEEPEDDTDDKMDVESEEDDDDQEEGIRKPPTGGRRRRVAVDEEDEDD